MKKQDQAIRVTVANARRITEYFITKGWWFKHTTGGPGKRIIKFSAAVDLYPVRIRGIKFEMVA